MEAIPQNFSQLRQKIFFRARPKYFKDFFGYYVNENHSKPIMEYPYTRRIDRENKHFQIMQKSLPG